MKILFALIMWRGEVSFWGLRTHSLSKTWGKSIMMMSTANEDELNSALNLIMVG